MLASTPRSLRRQLGALAPPAWKRKRKAHKRENVRHAAAVTPEAQLARRREDYNNDTSPISLRIQPSLVCVCLWRNASVFRSHTRGNGSSTPYKDKEKRAASFLQSHRGPVGVASSRVTWTAHSQELTQPPVRAKTKRAPLFVLQGNNSELPELSSAYTKYNGSALSLTRHALNGNLPYHQDPGQSACPFEHASGGSSTSSPSCS